MKKMQQTNLTEEELKKVYDKLKKYNDLEMILSEPSGVWEEDKDLFETMYLQQLEFSSDEIETEDII